MSHSGTANSLEKTEIPSAGSSGDAPEGRVQLTVIPGGLPVHSPAETRLEAETHFAEAGDPAALAARSSTGIRIRLDIFDGPMDLFLHLVQQQEVDISRVSMRLVAEQYLTVVNSLLNELEGDPAAFLRYDLEQVSEYLVIAATLTALKSSAVLPNSSTDGLLENIEPASEEFLEELRERLRLYEETKRRAEKLLQLPQLGVDTFSRVDRKALLPTPEMLQEPDDPRSLGEHLTRLMKRIGAFGQVFRVRLEPLSIVSSMMRIVDMLSEKVGEKAGESSRSTFAGILRAFRKDRPVKDREAATTIIIGNFLAVLELVKRGLLSAAQSDDGADIEISLRSAGEGEAASGDPQTFTSEFDAVPDQIIEMRDEVNRVS